MEAVRSWASSRKLPNFLIKGVCTLFIELPLSQFAFAQPTASRVFSGQDGEVRAISSLSRFGKDFLNQRFEARVTA